MKWKLIENNRPNGQQEIKVKLLLLDMAEITFATYADAFINQFIDRVKEIPRTNNFSAELLFKATPRNPKSVEIWKLKADGDFKYKMFTLDFVGE